MGSAVETGGVEVLTVSYGDQGLMGGLGELVGAVELAEVEG